MEDVVESDWKEMARNVIVRNVSVKAHDESFKKTSYSWNIMTMAPWRPVNRGSRSISPATTISSSFGASTPESEPSLTVHLSRSISSVSPGEKRGTIHLGIMAVGHHASAGVVSTSTVESPDAEMKL